MRFGLRSGAVAFVVLAVTVPLPKPSARPRIDHVGALGLATAAADPKLPLGLFRDRAFAIPVAISFLIGFALFGTVAYLPAFLQVALGPRHPGGPGGDHPAGGRAAHHGDLRAAHHPDRALQATSRIASSARHWQRSAWPY